MTELTMGPAANLDSTKSRPTSSVTPPRRRRSPSTAEQSRPPAEVIRGLVERSAGAQGLPARVVDAATLRTVAIVIAGQPNKPRERTAARERARSEMEVKGTGVARRAVVA